MKEIKVILDNFEFKKLLLKEIEEKYICFKFYVELKNKKYEKAKIKEKICKFLEVSRNLFNFYNFHYLDYLGGMISFLILSYQFNVNYFFYINFVKSIFEKIFNEELSLNLVFSRRIFNLIKYLKELKNKNEELKKEFDIQFSFYKLICEKHSNSFCVWVDPCSIYEIYKTSPTYEFYFLNGVINILGNSKSYNFFIEDEEVSSIVSFINSSPAPKFYFIFRNIDKVVKKFGEKKFKKEIIEHVRNYFESLFFEFFDVSCKFFDIK